MTRFSDPSRDNTPATSAAKNDRKSTKGKTHKAKPQDAITQTSPAPLDLSAPSAAGLPIDNPSELTPSRDEVHAPRLQALFDVAEGYGTRSFDNYARIRSLAETLRDEFCAWLSERSGCVYLVPPEGRFSAKNYQSAAFSVAGKGYLPLKPISFGLAVLVSPDKDYMRLKMTCRIEGDVMFVRIERGAEVRVPQPLADGDIAPLIEQTYQHLLDFFQDRVDDFDNGTYGTQEIGFDIQRMTVGSA